jgi:hypothetical protein
VHMHRALGPTGGARGVEPETNVIARGGRGRGPGVGIRNQILEQAMPAGDSGGGLSPPFAVSDVPAFTSRTTAATAAAVLAHRARGIASER